MSDARATRRACASALGFVKGGGDGIYLDEEAVVQLSGGNDGARGAGIAHQALVDLVDSAPQADVRNVDRHLQDVAHIAAGRLENRADVFEHLSSLLFDGPKDFFSRARVDGKLARDVDEAVVDDGLRVVAAGGGRVGGRDRFDLHNLDQRISASAGHAARL